MTTTVTEGNTVAIPGELAAELGIKPGTQLEWQAAALPDTAIVTIRPDRAAVIATLFGAGRKYLNPVKTRSMTLCASERRKRTDGNHHCDNAPTGYLGDPGPLPQ